MAPPVVCLVEDDRSLAAMIGEFLENNGYRVVVATDGEAAVRLIIDAAPDAVLLDINLPRLDGFGVCQRVRTDYDGPILMLTARDNDLDEVYGLEYGADDYIRKPVKPGILLARLAAQLRRAQGKVSRTRSVEPLSIGPLVLTPDTRECRRDGRAVTLTGAEFDLLWYLAEREGRTVSRDELYRALRGIAYDGIDRSIDLRVSRIRKKLDATGATFDLIRSIRGVGYVLSVPSPSEKDA